MNKQPGDNDAYPGASTTRYADDKVARKLVAELGSMTNGMIGVVIGASHQRVSQIVKSCYPKIRRNARKLGLDADEIIDWLRTRSALAASRERVYPEAIAEERDRDEKRRRSGNG